MPTAWQAEEDEGGGGEEGEVTERRRDAELAGDETAEAAAFERLAVQDVDVVEGVGGEPDEQHRRGQRAEPRRARRQEQDGDGQLRGDHGDGEGPEQAAFDEVREVRDEAADGEELRARREEEERREPEAADVDEQPEKRTAFHRSLIRVGIGGKKPRG